ncbi:chemotaxis protein CheW [Catenovulum sediminis]|uniref:Chemotaxis protein CheW n=1 Tax=Catenovulum sediminis TaxID=1740262 RepID=A0ABV1RLM8_9ALTE|nr:chemotaxis protein CheW [Catenovulum sediminis]
MIEEINKKLEQLNESASEDLNQYLSFFINDEEYAVDILRVQEIRCWEGATVIPNSPKYIKGVMNLRGTIVPVMDLRARLSIEERPYNAMTVVIVLKFYTVKDSAKISGIVVDAVADVHALKAQDIQPAPELACNVNAAFVKGLGRSEKGALILLEPDALLTIQ